jgi:hypothetical protein
MMAFPDPHRTDVKGMTLRDYFAGQALLGLLASDVTSPLETFVKQSYRVADAMLKARSVNAPTED